MIQQLKTGRKLATLFTALSLIFLALLYMGRHAAQASPAAAIAVALPGVPAAAWQRELAWARVREDGAGFVQVMRDGGRVELTLDPALQHRAERILADAPAPYAAAVVLSVDDGRVLAMVGHSTAEPDKSAAELTLKPWAPAASIFKLVTASALVEQGLSSDTRVCYHDGVHSVEASNLTAHPRWDSACQTLAFGVAKSQNAIIARLAHDHLEPIDLSKMARGFGFGAPLAFELPIEASTAVVPDDDLAFARVAAGFYATTLSPMHGAYLAATLARGGVTPPLRLVDQVVARDGETTRPVGATERRVISEEAARAVSRMMVGTTQYGTARLGFHDKRSGRPLLPGVAVAGKTGSLNRAAGEGPFLSYSWFVGFAPAERPEIAVAVLLGNGEVWHKKAHNVAAELLSGYFHGAPIAPSPSRRLASR